MATYRVEPPDLEEWKSLDVHMTKLMVWEATTPAEESKRGALIAASLPNNSARCKEDLQDKFFEKVDGTKLVTEGGWELVKTFLKELVEADLYKRVRVWNELEECTDLCKSVRVWHVLEEFTGVTFGKSKYCEKW